MNKSCFIKPMYIFVAAFFFSFVCQGLLFKYDGINDNGLWWRQAQYVETNDANEFDMSAAYGHPGATIIDGTIVFHHLFGYTYRSSLHHFLAFFDALIIAGISVFCLLIRPTDFWWLVVIPMLSLDRLFYKYSATPPAEVASLIVVFFTLFSWWLYEKYELAFSHLAFFGVISGLAIATRADIGVFMTLTLLSLFISKISWKRALIPIAIAAVTFIAIDPFMWFMPLRHLVDLLYKAYIHYEGRLPYPSFNPSSFELLVWLFSVQVWVWLSILLAATLLFFRNQLTIKLPPPRLLFTLIIASLLLCGILITSRFQAMRYYLPIIYIWQVFLPILLFSLVSQLRFSFLISPTAQLFAQRTLKIFITVVLVGWSVWISEFPFKLIASKIIDIHP